MGLILDSSILIAAERKGDTPRAALRAIARHVPGEDIGISVVTAIELMHGAIRADSAQRKDARQQFLQELLDAIPVYPVNLSIALRTGQLDGENAAKGIRLALADLLIGVTALDLGFRIATRNVRHFRMIDGLQALLL